MCIAVQLKITRCCTAPSQIKSPKTAVDKALEEMKFLGLHISWKSFGERKAKCLTFKIGALFMLWVRKNVIMPSNKTTALCAWKSFSYGLWQCFSVVTVAACGVGTELRDPVREWISVGGAVSWHLQVMGVCRCPSEHSVDVTVRALLEVYERFNVLARCPWRRCWAQIVSLAHHRASFRLVFPLSFYFH